MKRLYLVRHGETLFNKQKRIQGWCDSPLTDLGKKQANAVKEYIVNHNIIIDEYYCSTSERCMDTLEIITDKPYTRLKELKEMNYGTLEAFPEYLAESDPEACKTYYLKYGGESSLDVRERMYHTLKNVMNKSQGTVLTVSHGGACFNFLKKIKADTSYLNGRSTNCGIFVLDYDGEFHLIDVIFNPYS